MKNILLMNTSFKNKGDALMNETIIKNVGAKYRWAIPVNLIFSTTNKERKYCVCLHSDLPGATAKQRLFNCLVKIAAGLLTLTPKSVRTRIGVMILSDIEVAIDVSGYCYGDHWGLRKIETGSKNYEALKSRNAKIILMPKTWGPFTTIPSEAVNNMISFVDLVFARDKTSHATLYAVCSDLNREKIVFSPDYTHQSHDETSEAILETKNDSISNQTAFIIPSSRVIDSNTLSRESYYHLISYARDLFLKNGLQPKLLIHETSNDLRFANDSLKMGFPGEDVVRIDDPLDLKHAISNAHAVLTSRLHGLYNALNAFVPVAVIAWCFKYNEALIQYGCEDCLVDLGRPVDSLTEKVQKITNPAERSRLIVNMKNGKKASSEFSNHMWKLIQILIDKE